MKRTFVDALSGNGVLPSQYFPAAVNGEPEHRLIIAVLRNAVECLEKYRSATDRPGQQLFRDEQRWFLASAGDWPYSFEGICEVLDLDADAVREHLKLAAGANRARANTRGQRSGTAGADQHRQRRAPESRERRTGRFKEARGLSAARE